ncbi:MAG: SRPBCC family protein [Solirubrobacteraceae bacterium]|nr:SRPBCC family protein [Solirubrobacteraceae bacterium]
MKLTNEFTVGADVEKVWRTLLDMEGVASCLPGATIEATDEENVYKGSMRMKIGPMTVSYSGTAKLAEIDESARCAVIALSAREAKGQGTAMATITNRVEPVNGGARVMAETDLHITGPQARFGRGVMDDVAGRMLEEFSSRLEQKITGPPEPEPGAAGESVNGARPASQPAPEVLDVGAVLSQTELVRRARAIAPVALAFLLLLVLLRRRTD